jgi:VRR-NUC domain
MTGVVLKHALSERGNDLYQTPKVAVEAYRKPTEAKILQGLGVTSGVPDVIAIKDGRTYALELKAEGGKLTEAQQHALIKLREAGATATHAHGLDQALRVLEGWGLLRGRSA